MAITLILGLLFLVTAFASVFLMFHLWGYPFDKATRTSAAPPGLMRCTGSSASPTRSSTW
jgi:hypothetical protein